MMRDASPDGPIDADTFLDAFVNGRTAEIAGRDVVGNVSLHGREVSAVARALNVTFWGEVDFADCHFQRSLDLTGCQFAKTFSLRNSEVDGSLDLSEIMVRGEGSATGRHLPDTRSLDLRGVQVANDLVLSRCAVQDRGEPGNLLGIVDATGARIGGNAVFDASRIESVLELSGARIGGDLRIAAQIDDGSTRDGTAFLGGLNATNSTIEGNLALNGCRVLFDINLWASEVRGVFFFQPAFADAPNAPDSDSPPDCEPPIVGGSMNMGACAIAICSWQAVSVSGAVEIFSAEIGRFSTDYRRSTIPCSFGALDIQGVRVTNDLDLSGICVTGRAAAVAWRGLRIEATSVAGDLLLWKASKLGQDKTRERIESDSAYQPQSLRTVIEGDISIVGCTVGGELDLTNAVVSGRIVLDDSEVTRDIAMRSVASAAHDLERGGVRPLDDAPDDFIATRAQALSMVNVTCHNDIDITGLILSEPGAPDPGLHDPQMRHEPPQGFVIAQGCKVTSTLELYRVRPEAWGGPATDESGLSRFRDCQGSAARIPNALNLAGATMGEIAISARSFEADPSEDVEKVGIVLANATIDKFHLARKVCDGRRMRVPRPIDFRNVSVAQWDIHEEEMRSLRIDRYDAFDYLLQAERPFRRSTHLLIETALRDRGHDADADRVYRRMVLQADMTSLGDRNRGLLALLSSTHPDPRGRPSGDRPGLLRRAGRGVVGLLRGARDLAISILFALLRFFFWFFLGYGTKPGRLILFILALWFALLPFYAARENFEPSLAVLATETAPGSRAPERGAVPPEEDWTLAAAVSVSFRYHLPMLALDTRDEWDLREEGEALWDVATLSGVPAWRATLGLSPEDVGLYALILNWIAWPLVLAFVLRKALRIDRART